MLQNHKMCCKTWKDISRPGMYKIEFLSSSDVLFNGLHSEHTIFFRIKDVSMSAGSVEKHICEMAENVNKQEANTSISRGWGQ